MFQAAVALADAHGIEALTMRRLAEELGAEAMSLYHHVANKEQVLDGVVELVAGEINDAVDRIGAELAKPADWKGVVRRRILAAREVMLRHQWAPGVFETRTNMSLAVVRYHDALVGLMRAGGFTYDQIHHALHALGSRALGFTQELFNPAPGDAQSGADAGRPGRTGAQPGRHAGRGRPRRSRLHARVVRRPDRVRVRARPAPRRSRPAPAEAPLTSPS